MERTAVNPWTWSVNFGFNASHTGTNPRPTAFTLNGTACTIA